MKKALLLFLLSLSAATASRADVIYTTFGPGQSFLASANWPVQGPQVTEFAASFVPAGNFTLDSIQLALVLLSGSAALNVQVANDNMSAPGTPIETLSTTDITTTPAVVTIDSLSHPPLLSGATYWVVLSSGVTNEIGWNWNDAEIVGVSRLTAPSTTWMPLGTEVSTPAFEVDGTPVSAIPEPADLWLMTAPLAVFLAACRTSWIRHPSRHRLPGNRSVTPVRV